MTEKDELLASTATVPAGAASDAAHAEGPRPGLEPLYVPLRRATEISGLGRSTLYREAMAGRLRFAKAGRSTLVCYASLKALLDGLPAARFRNAA